MTVKKIAVIGSTGSIGKSTLEVASHLGKERVEVVALIAGSNISLLEQQVRAFNPKIAVLNDPKACAELRQNLKNSGLKTVVLEGQQGILEAISDSDVNFVVSAMVGSLGLVPTLEALSQGKNSGSC